MRGIKKFFLAAAVVALVAVSSPAYAAFKKGCTFKSGSGLLGFVESRGCSSALLAEYIVSLNEFLLRLAIVLAVLMIAIGGFQWLMAIGNSSRISNAKDTIQQAVIGLILAMTATLLFSQIDKSFTELDKGLFDIVEPTTQTEGCLQCTTNAYLYNHPDATAEAAELWARDECCASLGNACEWAGNVCKPKGNTMCEALYASMRQMKEQTPGDPHCMTLRDSKTISCIKDQSILGWYGGCCGAGSGPEARVVPVLYDQYSSDTSCPEECGNYENTSLSADACGW